MERVVRGYRRAHRKEENQREQRRQALRSLRTWTDEDGMLVVEGRLEPEAGAALARALEAAMARMRARDSAEAPSESADRRDDSAESSMSTKGTPRRSEWTPSQLRADALGLVAECALAGGLRAEAATERGDVGRPGAERTMVVVHVDAEALADPDQDGRSELEEGPALAPDAVRRLACDASVVRMSRGPDGSVLDVGRKTRSLPTRLRRALVARDQGCRFPGCNRTRYLQGHHVKHWANGGETKLANLLHLCWFHHRAVHEGGFGVEHGTNGDFVFRDRRGQVFASPPPVALPPDPVGALAARNREAGLAIAARTRNTWHGERMDLGLAVGCLTEREDPHLVALRAARTARDAARDSAEASCQPGA